MYTKKLKLSRRLKTLTAILLIASVLFCAGCSSVKKEENIPKYTELSDFKGKRVASISGSITGEIAERIIGEMDCKFYATPSDMALALKKGEVDAVVYDLPVTQYLEALNPELKLFPQIVAEDYYGFVLQKNSPYTQEISRIIEELKEDGTIDALKEKWISHADEEPLLDYSKYNLADRGKGVLRCNSDPIVAPFVYMGEDRTGPQGFEAELICIVADKMDMGITFRTEKFETMLLSVTNDEADLGFGCISITDERRQSVDFASCHYEGGVSVLCRRENLVAADEIQLNSPQISIVGDGDSMVKAFVTEKYPDAKYVTVNNEQDGYLALTSGKANAFALSKLQYECIAMAEERPITALHKDGIVGTVKIVAPISPKTQIPDAKNLVNKFLAQVKSDGTIADMEKRWMIEKDFTMPEIKLSDNPKFKITVGTTALAAPSTFTQDNKLVGFDIELAYRFAQWCDAELEFKTYSWDGVVLACKNGEVDYIFSDLFDTPERREAMDMSDPYLNVDIVVAVMREETAAAPGFWEGLKTSFEKTFIRENRWKMIGKGLGVTFEILLASMFFGTLLGFGVCGVLCSKKKIVSALGRVFCCVLGRIPGMVILLISNFVIFKSDLFNPLAVSIITFSVMFSANVGDIMSTGIKDTDYGQTEAALALGFGKVTAFFKVIAPQALRRIMPHYKSAVVSLLMTTAIVGYISIEDLTRASDLIRSRTYEAFFPLITTALLYFLISSVIILIIDRIEIKAFGKKKALKGVVPVSDVKREAPAPSDAKQGERDVIITVSHLKKVYDAGTPLTDVNTQIRRGDVISVIGPSGTGKSTLLRCINRMETPTEGEIKVFGNSVCDKKADLTLIRRRMGMVFQSFNLFPHLTVAENVMLAPMCLLKQTKQEAYENAIRLLNSVGVAEKAMSYPDELSGGQKQRVAIARTIAMKPEIILFDEPTSALDPTSVGEVLAVIRGLAKEGYTMMIVTHEMKFAKNVSNRTFYMDEGIIYEDGTPEVIFEAPEKIKTRAFVRGLKVLSFTIDSPEYDFIALAEKLRAFGERNRLDGRGIDNIYRAFDEICAMGIVPRKQGDYSLCVVAEYSEENGETTLSFTWGGEENNPLKNTDDLSVVLLKSYMKDISYKYENGKNLLTALI